jgi:predicted 3-demethylubiquinone-9 3-methyltransferase (glyoxalase superfamily)
MQKIVPHLWFDKEAKEAAEFYVSTFGGNSRIGKIVTLHNTPSGDAAIVPFELWGFEFQSISAGPLFAFNPSISLMVNFDPAQMENARERLDEIWNNLMKGGEVLIPLDKYPFSERYGWVQDKFGLSWQLILTNPEGEKRPLIMPSLLFVGDKCGKAEEAVNFWVSIFSGGPGQAEQTKAGEIARYPAGSEPDREGTVMFTDFRLAGTWLAAMDSARAHAFAFNEAISLMVNCKDQEEIDYYWSRLSAVPEAEQCGWLKDKYGVSWQVTPERMNEMMENGTKEQIDRVTQAFLPMKKFDLAELERAYKGE